MFDVGVTVRSAESGSRQGNVSRIAHSHVCPQVVQELHVEGKEAQRFSRKPSCNARTWTLLLLV